MAEHGPALRRAQAADGSVAARLHAAGFAGQERSWRATEFEALLKTPGSFLFLAALAPGATDAGVLLGRAQSGEAELLTIATAPDARRAGLARALLVCFEREARALGADHAFLEVAEDNGPARQLYSIAGWHEVGRRKAYVKRLSGPRVDAIVMCRALA
jgi:ribosomal-protein-alanine N-acetyltransferase